MINRRLGSTIVGGFLFVFQLLNTVPAQCQNNPTKLNTSTDKTTKDKQNVEIKNANELLLAGKYDQSIKVLNSIVQKDPRCTLAYWLRGVAYESTNRHEQALRDFNQILKVQPKNTEVLKHKAIALFKLGKKELAFKEIDKSIELDTRAPDFYVLSSILHRCTGDDEAALSACNEGIKKARPSATLYAERSMINERLRNYQAAKNDAEKALKMDPQNRDGYTVRAMCWKALGNNKKAIIDLTEAIRRWPDNPHLYTARAVCYSSDKQYKLAENDCRKLLAMNAIPAHAYSVLVELHRKTEKFPNKEYLSKLGKDALNSATKWIEKEPWNFDAYANRAEIYRRLLQDDRALKDIDMALTKSPKNPILLHMKYEINMSKAECDAASRDLKEIEDLDRAGAGAGHSAYLRGRYELLHGRGLEAAKSFSEAIKKQPQLCDLYVSRSDAYSLLGLYDKALADLATAKRLGCDPVQIAHNRAYVLKKAGRKDEAIKAFREFLPSNTMPGRVYMDYAELLESTGQVKNAIEIVSIAISMNNKVDHRFLYRARLYEKLKEYDKAIKDYSDALTANEFCFEAYPRRAAVYEKVGKNRLAEKDRRAYEIALGQSRAVLDSNRLLERFGDFK